MWKFILGCMEAKTTAIILVGYQNAYFAPDGVLRGVVEEAGRVDQTLATTLHLLREIADTPVTIVHTPIVLAPDYRALANAVGILDTIKESGAFSKGTPGAEILPEIAAFGDRIITVTGKVGFNGFVNTELETLLRERQIRDVLLAGMITSLCIDSTGRAAYERGYRISVLSDCTASRTRSEQDFYCQNIFPLYGSVTSHNELLSAVV